MPLLPPVTNTILFLNSFSVFLQEDCLPKISVDTESFAWFGQESDPEVQWDLVLFVDYHCKKCKIYTEFRDYKRPSDHVPVLLEMSP